MHVHWREHSLRTQKLKQKTASWHCSRPLAGPEELSGETNTSSTAYVIFVSQPELHVGKDASITEAPNCNSGVYRGQRQLSHGSPGYLCHRSGFCPRAVVRESPCPTLSLQATLAMAHGGHSHTGPGAHSPGAGASLPTTSHTQPWPQNPCQAAQLASPALGIILGNCSLLACFGKTKWEIHGQNAANGVTSTQVCTPGQGWQGIIWHRNAGLLGRDQPHRDICQGWAPGQINLPCEKICLISQLSFFWPWSFLHTFLPTEHSVVPEPVKDTVVSFYPPST